MRENLSRQDKETDHSTLNWQRKKFSNISTKKEKKKIIIKQEDKR